MRASAARPRPTGPAAAAGSGRVLATSGPEIQASDVRGFRLMSRPQSDVGGNVPPPEGVTAGRRDIVPHNGRHGWGTTGHTHSRGIHPGCCEYANARQTSSVDIAGPVAPCDLLCYADTAQAERSLRPMRVRVEQS